MLRPITSKTILLRATSRNFTTNPILRSTTTTTTTASASTSTYTPPISKGKLIAYDESLIYLNQDKELKLKKLKELNKIEKDDKDLVERLEIEALVNDPEIRWKSENGLGDLSQPIYRELAERKWRKDGSLAILMQRVLQMSVVPDLIASIDPIVDLRIEIQGQEIVPGVFVSPEQTQSEFKVIANVYHPETRLYTLLLIDPDVPDEQSHSFTTYAHWLVPNIPLSSTNSTINSPSLLPYIPPHPQSGTPYHRYTIFLLAQPLNPTTNNYTTIDLVEEAIERESMNVREFISNHQLEPVGVNFFREKWSKSVSEIYKKAFNGQEELKFGNRPKSNKRQFIAGGGVNGGKYSLE